MISMFDVVRDILNEIEEESEISDTFSCVFQGRTIQIFTVDFGMRNYIIECVTDSCPTIDYTTCNDTDGYYITFIH